MDWTQAFTRMRAIAVLDKNHKTGDPFWQYGQENTISWIAEQLAIPGRRGVLVADEVGMGKTRVVMGAILSVLEAGGTVATIVPPGLLYQWKKEWDDFINALDGSGYKDYAPVILRSYNSIFERQELDFPLGKNTGRNKGKWLLVSHQFGSPRLATNSRSRRYLLPILVKAIHQGRHGMRHNSHWQLVKKHYGDASCIGFNCEECERRGDCDSWYIMMNKAARFLRKETRWQLFNNIPERALKENADEFKDWFNGEKGHAMLGELLGPIDLVVIDEAHKNRSEDGKLEVNLSKIIQRSDTAKHIAMTATPMELSPEQWSGLFSRIGESAAYPEKVISEFDAAYCNANKYPNNQDVVRDLVVKSTRFAEALKPFVTRRLRIKQTRMLDLLGLTPQNWGQYAHPHRDYSRPVKIDFSNIEDAWKPSIFALEAIAKAAKGCSTDSQELNHLLGRLKISDSRYAAAQITDSDTGMDAPDENKLDTAIAEYLYAEPSKESDQKLGATQGKLLRISYWRNLLKASKTDLAGHPRIQHVADIIDEFVWRKGGVFTGEKVLVFGTFKRPLHVLRTVLNDRSLLRFLDRRKIGATSEPPIPAVEACLKDLSRIYLEYQRISRNETLKLVNRTFSSEAELERALLNGKKAYDSLRERISKHINEAFVAELPGDSAIGAKKKVAELLRSRLINELICRGDTEERHNPREIKNKALDIWVDYLESYFDKEENEKEVEGRSAKTEWEKPKWFEGEEKRIERLDRIADHVLQEDLEDMVNKEMDYISGRLGFFARTLDGDVKMETRRVLQSQFNAKDSFPQVLIAQSQVGREGLNLHKACRTVIQFHSEWNPGVVEQQIGRVDRIGSFWEEKAAEYSRRSVADNDFPKIGIHSVVFDGTYDHFQYNVSKQRRETLNAHLFGELLNEEALTNMPKDGDWEKIRDDIKRVAPEFSPPNKVAAIAEEP